MGRGFDMNFNVDVVRSMEEGTVFESGTLFPGIAPHEKVVWTVIEVVNEGDESSRLVCRLQWLGVYIGNAVIIRDKTGCYLKEKVVGQEKVVG